MCYQSALFQFPLLLLLFFFKTETLLFNPSITCFAQRFKNLCGSQGGNHLAQRKCNTSLMKQVVHAAVTGSIRTHRIHQLKGREIEQNLDVHSSDLL